MIIWVIILIFLLLIILFFTSRKLSPIPYFPSNKQDLPLIVDALNLRNSQTVVDLGAGDGIIILEAAKQAQKRKLHTKFIAVEINPVLVLILYLRRLLHPNKQNVRIILADMFSLNVSKLARRNVTVFLYISPWFMERVYKKLKTDLEYFELVSYFYPLKKIEADKKIRGKNEIFVYRRS